MVKKVEKKGIVFALKNRLFGVTLIVTDPMHWVNEQLPESHTLTWKPYYETVAESKNEPAVDHDASTATGN